MVFLQRRGLQVGEIHNRNGEVFRVSVGIFCFPRVTQPSLSNAFGSMADSFDTGT